MRVLAVGAHPDDLEILCAGTLLRFVDEGHSVVMCHVTTGDKGSYTRKPAELAPIRIEEARRAAAVAGAEHVTLGLRDGEVNASDPEQRGRMVDLFREVRADLIVTHYPVDYQVDHTDVSRLVLDASFYASAPHFRPGRGEATPVVPVYYMESFGGFDFAPTEFVDITEVMPRKIEMLKEHRSQLEWLRDHDGEDVVERIKTTARFRGFQSGVIYAEAFVPCLRWLRTRTRRLLPET